MPFPSHYQVDHLFVLVGDNPLPNYVAAKCLLAPKGKRELYLIHTTKTEKTAERLDAVLSKDNVSAQYILLEETADLPGQIDRHITRVANRATGTLGLHYTGGTKIMAVHAYRALDSVDAESQFSYLDSQKLAMCIEENNRLTYSKITAEVDFKTLFTLHGLELNPDKREKLSTVLKLPEVSLEIAETVTQKKLDIAPTSFRSDLKKTVAAARQESLKKHHFADENNNLLFEKLLQSSSFVSEDEAEAWAKGGHWLEDYVLDQVQHVKDQGITDYCIDFSICVGHEQYSRAARNGQLYRDDFQLDVAFMRHYQLFVLSCATSAHPTECKAKLLEAYVRAKQIGGSEARVALVCGVAEPKKLSNEIKVANPDIKVEVFGYEQWENLSDHIADWIQRL
ncbi:MAG: DUF1887 family CARF protein [Cyanobacteria bacterium J06634_6]